MKRHSGENVVKTAKKCQIWKVPEKESFHIWKVPNKESFIYGKCQTRKESKSAASKLSEIRTAESFLPCLERVPRKESLQIRQVFRKGKSSNEESAEAKANKESSVRGLFKIQIADISFLIQRCAHTAAVISSNLGSKIS